MIFKNYSESASLLAQKIQSEQLQNPMLVYIDHDDQPYCQLVAQNLNLPLSYLPDLISNLPATPNVIILDSGQTSAQEYNEFTDIIRKKLPIVQITLAIPVIPTAEETTLKSLCDRLLTLHVEPLFFSIDQFYETH
ncbi:MAG: hypothetical protein WC596_00960 [Candidatus Shapirobacteria bacterium]